MARVGTKTVRRCPGELLAPKPLHSLANVRHGAKHNFSVEVVRKGGDKLTLDRYGVSEHAEIMRQLVVVRDDDACTLVGGLATFRESTRPCVFRRSLEDITSCHAERRRFSRMSTFPRCVELWAPCTTEDLLDIEHAKVLEAASLGIVHLSPLDDHCVRREVDTPSQSRRTDENLQREEAILFSMSAISRVHGRGKVGPHLDDTLCEHLLCERAVRPEHAGMVAAEPSRCKLT